jgi:hypothetical protein
MTEIPGTDRDQARKNVEEQTPLAPEDIEGDDEEHIHPHGDDGVTGDAVKPGHGGSDPDA